MQLSNDKFSAALRERLVVLTRRQEELRQELALSERQIAAIQILGNGQLIVDADPDNKSLAPAVRASLRRIGKAASPTDVEKNLREHGFKPDQPKGFVTRVNSELYRQAKSKTIPVVRAGRGMYAIDE